MNPVLIVTHQHTRLFVRRSATLVGLVAAALSTITTEAAAEPPDFAQVAAQNPVQAPDSVGTKAADSAKAPLAEGWERKIEIVAAARRFLRPDEQQAKALLKVRVEKGWLVVRRETAAGDLEWHVVLARASDPAEPVIKVEPTLGALQVNYRGYFLRESATGARLRVYREPKTDKSPEWPAAEIKGRQDVRGISSGSVRVAMVDHWYWVEDGPTAKTPPDITLRLRPVTPRIYFQSSEVVEAGQGSFNVDGGPQEIFLGESRVLVEPDLFLVNDRITPDHAQHGIPAIYLRKWLEKRGQTFEAQPITGRAWVSGEERSLLINDQLKGRVTIVGFWSTDYEPSATQLARLQELHRKYADKKVSVLAVHAPRAKERDDELRAFLRERSVTFPVMIDRGDPIALSLYNYGETAKRYHVDVQPAFFLIDKGGAISLGYGMAPPDEAEIDELLSQPVGEIAPALDAKRWINTPQPLALEKLRGKIVLLAFRDSTVIRPGTNPIFVDPLETLQKELGKNDAIIIGVQRNADDAQVDANVKQRSVTFPVLVDAGETVKRYAVKGTPEYVLIDKSGKVTGWERRALPTAADIKKLVNAKPGE